MPGTSHSGYKNFRSCSAELARISSQPKTTCNGMRIGFGYTKSLISNTMPPKKDSTGVIFLKLKRQSSAYFVRISKKDTVLQLKNVLADMINQTGGLRLVDKPIPINDVMDVMNDQNIDIPKVGLNDNSDSEMDNDVADTTDNKNDTELNQTGINDPNIVKVSFEDLSLGAFEDQNNIYNTNIGEFTYEDTDKLESLPLQEFNIIPFKYKDEKFELFKPLD